MNELGITTTKTGDFGDWYRQIILKGKLIDYYDVSGCYVLLPNAYTVWEHIQRYLQGEFNKRQIQNVYFPLFITKKNLEKEKEHIEGFEPEVAWVTRTGSKNLKDEYTDSKGDEKVDEKVDTASFIAVRPTSECAIYPTFSRLVQSYQDLPLKYNQWCNVVRWEFKDPLPFIRSREFLWQEGHTCHTTIMDSVVEMCDILDVYAACYGDLLAVPVIKGYKTKKEKFGGAAETLTVEGYIPVAGKGVQCATSHSLGQNFSKIFNIVFQDGRGDKRFVWQNCWGFTTRSIGVMLMTHSDNHGIVFPPKIAPIQIVIIPIIFKDNKKQILDYAQSILNKLSPAFRIHVDSRNYTPGWKHNHWEMMGVPLRIEVGPRDIKDNTLRYVTRLAAQKHDIDVSDQLVARLSFILNDIHHHLYERARTVLHDAIVSVTQIDEFADILLNKKMCLAPFCGGIQCEDLIKELTGAKSLCIPFEQDNNAGSCVICSNVTTERCLFGLSF